MFVDRKLRYSQLQWSPKNLNLDFKSSRLHQKICIKYVENLEIICQNKISCTEYD